MKITRTLELDEYHKKYLVPATKKLTDAFERWALCGDFVLALVGHFPKLVKITVSDKPFEGAKLVAITSKFGKNGNFIFCKWNWVDPSMKRQDEGTGMYDHAQNIVKRLVKKNDFILYVAAVPADFD